MSRLSDSARELLEGAAAPPPEPTDVKLVLTIFFVAVLLISLFGCVMRCRVIRTWENWDKRGIPRSALETRKEK